MQISISTCVLVHVLLLWPLAIAETQLSPDFVQPLADINQITIKYCNEDTHPELLPVLPDFAVPDSNNSKLKTGEIKIRLRKSHPFCGEKVQEFHLSEENGAIPIRNLSRSGFRDDGYLKIQKDFYSTEEYCLQSFSNTTFVVKFCPPTCQGQRPCIPKCLPPDQVMSFITATMAPKSSGSVQYLPRIYTDFPTEENPDSGESTVYPHFIQRHPRELPCKQKFLNFYDQERSNRLGGKFPPLKFRIQASGDVYIQVKDEYNCPTLKKLPANSYCVDGAQDVGREEPYRNNESEGIIFSCPAHQNEEEDKTRALATTYGVILILSSNFVLAVLIVHVLLWHLQNIHGWTIMAHSFTVFCAYIFLGSAHIISSGVLGNTDDTTCYVIGVFAYFFVISNFLWLTILNFDLWWTFRSIRTAQSHNAVERMVIQMCLGWGLPFLVVLVTVALETIIGDSCTIIPLPRFGLKRVCFVSPPYRGLYYYYPVALTLMGNLIFFVLTCYKLYSYSKVSAHAKNQVHKHRQMAILFLKMFVVMGVAWSFELISWLVSGDNLTWCWAMVDVFVVLQAFGIFLVYVCKRDVFISLEAKYPALGTYLFAHLRCCPCFLSEDRKQNESDVQPERTTKSSSAV